MIRLYYVKYFEYLPLVFIDGSNSLYAFAFNTGHDLIIFRNRGGQTVDRLLNYLIFDISTSHPF